MSIIKATLEVNPDGTVHLPVPPELRKGKLNVTASIEPAVTGNGAPRPSELRGFGALKGKIWMAPNFDEPLDDFEDYMK